MHPLNISSITLSCTTFKYGTIHFSGYVRLSKSFIIPSFIKFDFSELPALITAFSLGPWWGVAVCLIKNVLHLFIGSTAGVGELSNFVLGAVFVFVAGVVYKFTLGEL